MELVRKIAIGIVMMVPTFVLGGLVWAFLGSWWAILAWVIIMVFLCGGLVSGKFLTASKQS